MGVSESNEESTKSESQLHFVGSLELNRAKVVLETLLPLNLLLRSSAPWLSHGTTGQCQIAEASEPWSQGGHHVVWHIVVWSLIAAASNPGYACATADSPVSKTNGQDGQSRSVGWSIRKSQTLFCFSSSSFFCLGTHCRGLSNSIALPRSKVTIATRHGSVPTLLCKDDSFDSFPASRTFQPSYVFLSSAFTRSVYSRITWSQQHAETAASKWIERRSRLLTANQNPSKKVL